MKAPQGHSHQDEACIIGAPPVLLDKTVSHASDGHKSQMRRSASSAASSAVVQTGPCPVYVFL